MRGATRTASEAFSPMRVVPAVIAVPAPPMLQSPLMASSSNLTRRPTDELLAVTDRS